MKRLRNSDGVIVRVTDEKASYLLSQGYTLVEDEKTTEKAEKPARTRRKSSTKHAS